MPRNRRPNPKSLLPNLKSKLDGAARIAVVGIGSELRGDDAAGVIVAQNLQTRLEKEPSSVAVGVFIGGTAPENVTGAVRKFQPTHILLIDAADFGAAPGEIRLLDPMDAQNVSFSTHGLPVAMLSEYLNTETGAQVFLLGIQPKSTKFHEAISEEIQQAVDYAVEALCGILR